MIQVECKIWFSHIKNWGLSDGRPSGHGKGVAEKNIKDATWRNAGLLCLRQDVCITEFLHFLSMIPFFWWQWWHDKKTLRFFFQESSWINICWEMLNPSNVSEALPLDMAEGHSCRPAVPWRYDGRAGTNPETGYWWYVEQLWKIIQDWWRFRFHLLLDLEIMVHRWCHC